MPEISFFQTRMGARFFEGTMPQIADTLASIGCKLEALTAVLSSHAAPAPIATAPSVPQVIGVDTIYLEDGKLRSLRNQRVRICGVWRDEVAVSGPADHIFDDRKLFDTGGITKDDWVDVARFQSWGKLNPILETVRAGELACFGHLAAPAGAKEEAP
jgi:hypothetical protein